MGEFFVIDSETGRELWALETTNFPVRGLSFSPSGDRLLSGHWDGSADLESVAGHRHPRVSSHQGLQSGWSTEGDGDPLH